MFADRHERDMQMMKDMLRGSDGNRTANESLRPPDQSGSALVPGGSPNFSQFSGVLPNPLSGRTSKESSFVNVGSALKKGIEKYNSQVADGAPMIATDEFDGSLLKWSRQSSSMVEAIVGKYAGMNTCLGKCSLQRAKHHTVFSKSRSGRYNKEKSAVLEEIKKAIPIVCLAKGNWAANELLRNKFANSKARLSRAVKEQVPRQIRTAILDNESPGDDDEIVPTSSTRHASAGTNPDPKSNSTVRRNAAPLLKYDQEKQRASMRSRKGAAIPIRKSSTTILRGKKRLTSIFESDESSDEAASIRPSVTKSKNSSGQLMKQNLQKGRSSLRYAHGHSQGVKKSLRKQKNSRKKIALHSIPQKKSKMIVSSGKQARMKKRNDVSEGSEAEYEVRQVGDRCIEGGIIENDEYMEEGDELNMMGMQDSE